MQQTRYRWIVLMLCALLLAAGDASVIGRQQTVRSRSEAGRVLEIRSYNLKPGTRRQFHERFVSTAMPMLQRWKVDVVSYGPSRHDESSYYLMRAFTGVEERQRSEDAFYGSDEWKQGPREAVLADIESYTTVVIHVDNATLEGLRAAHRQQAEAKPAAGAAEDLAALASLNDDYIRSVQHSDVARFQQILADDFLCSQPDGSLVDRETFLRQTAQPVAIRNLTAHDVKIRLMGDVAIVHARTSYLTADGRQASGRYTDVWARRGGKWLAVSAHVTRG